MKKEHTPQTAVMKFSALGDIAATLPFIRAMDKPPCIITSPLGKAFLADEFSDFIILSNKSIWHLLKLIREIRKRKFSNLIDLQGNDRCRFISRYSASTVHNWYAMNAADQAPSDLLQEIAVKAAANLSFRKKEPTYIVLNAGSSAKWSAKRPPTWKWKEIAEKLNSRFELPIKLVGSSEEFEYIDTIAEALPGDIENLAGKTSLSELKNLLAHAFLTVSTDSAAMHIAAVQGTPTIGIFGSTTWKNKLSYPWTTALYDHTYYPDGNMPICTGTVDNYYDHIDIEKGLATLKDYIA